MWCRAAHEKRGVTRAYHSTYSLKTRRSYTRYVKGLIRPAIPAVVVLAKDIPAEDFAEENVKFSVLQSWNNKSYPVLSGSPSSATRYGTSGIAVYCRSGSATTNSTIVRVCMLLSSPHSVRTNPPKGWPMCAISERSCTRWRHAT